MSGQLCFKSHVMACALFTLLTLTGVSCLNYWFDPFGMFGAFEGGRIKQWNQLPDIRLGKAYAIVHKQPRTIILGTSRALTGISTSHPAWKIQPVYNAGLPGTTFDEIYSYFKHACEIAPICEALILLDYDTCNTHKQDNLNVGFDPGRLYNEQSWRNPFSVASDAARSLMSVDATAISLQAAFKMETKARYLPNGETDNFDIHKKILSQGGLQNSFKKVAATFSPVPVPLKKDWNSLKKVIELAARKKVRLHWLISPLHKVLLNIYRQRDGLDEMLNWRRQLIKTIFETSKANGLSLEPVWDFDGIEPQFMDIPSIILEAGEDLPLYFECSHFSKRLGDEILSSILNDDARQTPAFGHAITPDNLDARLKELQEVWRRRL